VSKMWATSPVGTHFFAFNMLTDMHMLGNLFVGQIAIKNYLESCRGSVVDKHRDGLVIIIIMFVH